jgi:pentatricopeptide repeat protein
MIHMKPEQFQKLLNKYEMTPAQCAEFLGSHPTTVYRWLMEGGNVPQSALMVFGLMMAAGLSPPVIESLVKEQLRKIR